MKETYNEAALVNIINQWGKDSMFNVSFAINGPRNITCRMRTNPPYKVKSVMGGEELFLSGAYLGKKWDGILRFTPVTLMPEVRFIEFALTDANQALNGFSKFWDKEIHQKIIDHTHRL